MPANSSLSYSAQDINSPTTALEYATVKEQGLDRLYYLLCIHSGGFLHFCQSSRFSYHYQASTS